MNSKVYKWCGVPLCNNTSIKTPKKLFVFVPHKKTTRDKWLKLARRDSTAITNTTQLYFCEDHFDMPNDMENYMEFKVMGSVSQIRMRPDCFPRKFECQSDRRKRTSNAKKRQNILKKPRKLLIEECNVDLEEKDNISEHLKLGKVSSRNSESHKNMSPTSTAPVVEYGMLQSEGEKSRMHDPLCENESSGQYKAQDLQLCRICFTTDDSLYSMKTDNNLNQAYESFTGLSVDNEENMPSYLCTQCYHQLMQCIDFRNKTLQAYSLLLEIVQTNHYITVDLIKSANETKDARSNLNVTQCSISHYSLENIQIKKENTCTSEEIGFTNVPFQEVIINDIKKENDYILSQECSKNDDVRSSSMPDDTLVSAFKEEKYDVYTDEDTISVDIVYGDTFEGEDLSSNDNILLTEKRHQTELCIEDGHNITTSKKLNQIKEQKRNTDDRLLVYDQLCCDLCPYKTVSDAKLLRHLKTHVNSKQKFACYLCKKTYSRKCGLQKHLKTHSDQKPFTCVVCKKGFYEKRDFENHWRTHSGEKPFVCDLCKKSFSERGNLLRHIRIHAGEKPYSCKVCGISFNQKHHLTRHSTVH